MGLANSPVTPKQLLELSPFAEACAKSDFITIYEMMEKVGYRDDEGLANDVSK